MTFDEAKAQAELKASYTGEDWAVIDNDTGEILDVVPADMYLDNQLYVAKAA